MAQKTVPKWRAALLYGFTLALAQSNTKTISVNGFHCVLMYVHLKLLCTPGAVHHVTASFDLQFTPIFLAHSSVPIDQRCKSSTNPYLTHVSMVRFGCHKPWKVGPA